MTIISSVLLIGIFLVLVSFVLSIGRLLSSLIILENFNVLLLFNSLMSVAAESRMLFLVFMVIFTVEAVLGLVILVQLWEVSALMYSVFE